MKKFLSVFLVFVFLLVSARGVLANCGKDEAGCPDKSVKIEQKGTDRFEVTTEDAKGFSKFPISYDPAKQVFVVTTPVGIKEVKASPKKAIEVAYTTGMLNEFEIVDGTKNVILLEKDGKVYYEVHGKKTGKVFGLWPVSFNVTATVDGNGKLVNFEKPWILKVLKYVMK